ncbi:MULTISPECIES: hypothetical protein [unclassified Arthrobacter]|uniref:hypothetical protein n=1 Tax=unclassified Arthrobacter TaxID=235627 RepID=UPI003391B9D1
MAIEVRPGTLFEDVRTVVGPKRLHANVGWPEVPDPGQASGSGRATAATASATCAKVTWSWPAALAPRPIEGYPADDKGT